MLLVIEMDDTHEASYGSIHKRGCRNVSDPMPMLVLSEPVNLATLTMAFNDTTGWDYEPIEVRNLLAPCASAYNQG